MTRAIKQRIEPIFLHATPLESVIIPHSRVKKWHRKKAKPKRENHKPAKAILPEGKYFYKIRRGNLKKYLAERRREDDTRKKLRGAKKKEAFRKYRLDNPDGPVYAKKPAPQHSQIVDTKVVARLTKKTIRHSRRYLTRIRKKLGKQKREWVTLSEFCEKTPFKPEDVIPYLE
jgi:hypothetical protein